MITTEEAMRASLHLVQRYGIDDWSVVWSDLYITAPKRVNGSLVKSCRGIEPSVRK